jgi:hypothetical protein
MKLFIRIVLILFSLNWFLPNASATELESNVSGNTPPPNINQNGNFQNSPTQIINGSQNTALCGFSLYAQTGSNFQNTTIQAGVTFNSNKCEKQSKVEEVRQNGETNRECIKARVQLEIAGKNPDVACNKLI